MTAEAPVKRRRLLIVDVETPPGEQQVFAPLVVRQETVPGPGRVHALAQLEVIEMAKKARVPLEKVEDEVWLKLDTILRAPTQETAQEVARKILSSLSIKFLLLTKDPEKQAKSAERIAKMWRDKGEDEKADAQLAKAARIRAEIQAELKA